jgi:hypothetical protein
MRKRKAVAVQPSLWKVGKLYLVPLRRDQYATIEYRKFRTVYPDIQVCFLTDAESFVQAILSELAEPSQFEETDSHYYVVPARAMGLDAKTISVGKFELKWTGKNLKCLGSRICKDCFVKGKMYPQTCPTHLHCGHGKQRDASCDACVAGTLLGYWKERVACFQGDRNSLLEISRGNKTNRSFKCGKCKHLFDIAPDSLTRGAWCPFCSNPPKKLCDDDACQMCYNKSFASHEKAIHWNNTKNPKSPRQVFKSSNLEFWFTCDLCFHDFDIGLNSVTSGSWCGFCKNKRLCEAETCQMCKEKSLASHSCSKDWHKTKNWPLTPRQVFKSSRKKRWFYCETCKHDFNIRLTNVVLLEQWCQFCAHHELCDNEMCHFCYENSFASHEKSKYWKLTKNGGITARQVFKHSGEKYWFDCATCNHEFDMSLLNIGSGQWCSFCVHRRRCDISTCTTCAKSCDVCKSKKAQTKTQVTKTWVCLVCLADAVKRDPKETPLSQRAKITLEIFTLAELLRQSPDGCFINNPTAWDCAILPGLAFKPDCIWCFDENGHLITLGRAEHLNLNIIRYALQLEIIEGSRATHSNVRNVSDEDREFGIRGLMSSQFIPLGILYVTISHNKHFNTCPEDVFFTKPGPDQEYQVLGNKLAAWIARVSEVRDTLLRMFVERSNETIYIGH